MGKLLGAVVTALVLVVALDVSLIWYTLLK